MSNPLQQVTGMADTKAVTSAVQHVTHAETGWTYTLEWARTEAGWVCTRVTNPAIGGSDSRPSPVGIAGEANIE